jgi:small-conductance mechanosensitive channel
MQTFLRALRLYAMVAWVGGLAFFAFVVAPVAFGTLSSAHQAGLVVGGTLRVLHLIGLIGGLVFCLATGWLWLAAEVPARVGFAREIVLTALMLVVTAYSQFRVLPAMEVDRALAGGEVETASLEDPGRVDFERLHRLSERLEGFVLICGLGVVFVLSRESQWPETGKPQTGKIVRP